jgi:hypothetical protein
VNYEPVGRSKSSKDEMTHEECGSAKDEQHDGSPKQQARSTPVVFLGLGLVHETPKLQSRRDLSSWLHPFLYI